MKLCDRCRVPGCLLDYGGKACKNARKQNCPDVVFTNADRVREMNDEELAKFMLTDYFLYENNKSMSPAIRAQITAELGVEPVLINSALVSAQNRQRIYWVGKREPDGTYSQVPVEQPEDRGILLRDILETGICWREKGYALTASSHSATAEDMFARRQRNGVAEPIRIGTIENDAKKQDFDSQQYRVYSPDGKSVTLCGNGGGVGAKTGLYAVPISAENNKVILKAIDILAERKGYVP